jgi:ATP-binding protein involved in chromosome partitioning
VTAEAVLEKLRKVIDPEIHRDIVSLNMVKGLRVDGQSVTLTVELTTPACPLKAQIEADVRAKLGEIEGLGAIHLTMTGRVSHTPQKNAIPGVKHVIAVGAGKGGVGKSTCAVNIALSLVRDGAAVGLLDADLYGPNIPTMLGIHEPEDIKDNRIIPASHLGLKIISMGFFLDPNEPVIWRGPMLHGAMKQFVQDVDWGELDYLIVDLPPGTGDVQLSLAQMIPLAGAVIVATPQRVALEDASKAVAMFKKVNVPVLGVIENMSYMLCPHCDERIEMFGHGGAERAASEWKVRFLGRIPMDIAIRRGGDDGDPVAMTDSPVAEAFREAARNIAGEISTRVLSQPREISLDGLILQR